MSKLSIKGHIWIENKSGHLIGPGRNQLLKAIKEKGSIKSAAKSMKMSYRHAWEMINEMNKNSTKLIVAKSPGGAHGGGSHLTKEGEMLIMAYDKLYASFEQFKLKMKDTI